LSAFFDPLTDLFSEAPASDLARTIERHALEAQQALLPYALIFFAFSLPVLVWAGSFADNAVWMSALFAQFAMNWAAFYVVVSWLRRRPDIATDAPARTRIHIFGGLLWAAAVAQLAAFSLGAGPAREAMLMISLGAAVVLFFFTCPSLPNLLIVGPAAAVAPLVALYTDAETQPHTLLAWGVVALAMALALMVNRVLRRQFAMAAEREVLVASRADSLARAERLAKSKSDILATLSHEVRNGLTGVTHVLKAATGSGGRAAPTRDQLAAALGAANDLLDVLNATLDSETAQAGKLQVSAELYRADAAAKGVELSFHADEALERSAAGAPVGDPMRVRQILANLLSNAVKYTARGRIEVRILLAASNRLHIEVADTGPGLSPEEIQQAFEPFSRIKRTGVGLPGAGLGLSLAQDLARLMDGQIVCRSAVGVGSRFCLELPFDAAARVATPLEECDPAAHMRQLKILVAEDDALNAAMLRAVLEQLGHQVAHAADGKRAYELAQACDFDVVMLDGRMPGMSGAETILALRSLAAPISRAPIIGVTGADAAEAQACIDAGADAVLRKPVSVAAVARALAQATSAAQRPVERTAVAV
jgi:two-component system, sensor histidine kinase